MLAVNNQIFMSETKAHIISHMEFASLIHPLVNLRVSRPWRGYGSALFLELGRLHKEPLARGKEYSLKGQATVMIQWSWRIERQGSIVLGSWSGERKMTNGIAQLKDRVVTAIALEGRLPELNLALSDGLWVHSFMTHEGQPEWTIFLFDGSWVGISRGRLYRWRYKEET